MATEKSHKKEEKIDPYEAVIRKLMEYDEGCENQKSESLGCGCGKEHEY